MSRPPSKAAGVRAQAAVFPSLDWCRTLADAIERAPESAAAGRGWKGTVCVAVLADECLPTPFIVFARVEDGRIPEIRELEDEDEIAETSPDYVAKGTFLTWKRFILGEYDPIEALLQRRISFQGDLTPIAERAQFKQLFWDTLASVPTRFADEAKPKAASGSSGKKKQGRAT